MGAENFHHYVGTARLNGLTSSLHKFIAIDGTAYITYIVVICPTKVVSKIMIHRGMEIGNDRGN